MPSSVRHRCDLLVRCLIVVKAVSIFIPLPQIMPRIFSFPPEIKSFDEYGEGWDNFVIVTTNRLDELRYNYLLVVQSSLISSLTNRILWRKKHQRPASG